MHNILEEISKNTKELNKDFDESLKVLKELYKNGVKLDDEQVKKNILEILENGNYKGEKGDAFTYEDFTPEQLQSLKGDSGAKGEDGKSAYEIWLNKEGNAGKSEDEFLASLKGEKGDKGEAGEQGAKGEKGDKGDSISKEELKPIVKEVVDELGLSNQAGSIITSTNLPSPDIKAQIGTLYNYCNKEKSTLFVCIDKKEQDSVWMDLLSKDEISFRKSLLFSFDIEKIAGQYGGCISDVLFYFEGSGWARTTLIQKGLTKGKFVIKKNGLGGIKSGVQEATQAREGLSDDYVLEDDEILGTIGTTNIYADERYHCITNALKQNYSFSNEEVADINGGMTHPLWNSSGNKITIELFTKEFPTKFFLRGAGSYGQNMIKNLKIGEATILIRKSLKTLSEIATLDLNTTLEQNEELVEFKEFQINTLAPFGTAKENENHAGYVFENATQAEFNNQTNTNNDENNLYKDYGRYANLFLITPKGE
ncbi:hypothetical protein CLC19245_00849 [Campylobacter lari subsp. concheus]|uniref:collagen-like protein n=1 Tax=Campylobacter lari TaxID=201 RepID=UPI00126C201F|nr:collagen-like protein [Campylobacter lari]EAK0948443.1 collagen-like protein [Campylobacter lari]EAK1241688.1 collagen-like protein [Campylobacter lari]MCR2070323.1 collagen-like protein [Campylobacter lari subsp. concheus]HEC1794491.1 collagen-like protein [Campylobacter lari]HEC1808741.1 collagen-like protein [Campylobacter lari]